MRKLVIGTIEQVDVHVDDDLGTLTSLDGLNTVFDVYDETDQKVINGQSANNVGMTAYCLVDTTSWTEGRYKLYLRFNNAPEVPYLGPLRLEAVNP